MNNYSPKQRRGQPVRFNGKAVGYIVDGVFEARRRSSKHLLQAVPGWAFSVEILEYLDEEGIEDIHLLDLDTRTQYTATLQDFCVSGVPINYFGDPQLCLPLSAWKVTLSQSEIRT